MEVTEQPVMAVILLPMMRQMGLSTTLAASTVAGTAEPVRAPPTQVEVAVAMIGGP